MARSRPSERILRAIVVLYAGLIVFGPYSHSQPAPLIEAPDRTPGDCSAILPMVQQNKVYLAYLKARAQQKDQAIMTFHWYEIDPPTGPDAFDPLYRWPKKIHQFSIEKSSLQGCNFPISAQLDEAIFRGSDLTGSTLIDASLKNVSFDELVLDSPQGRRHFRTILSKVRFSGGDLTGATFAGTEMAGAIFEPEKLPLASDISEAIDLQLMTYDHDPSALSSLRQRFRDEGFAQQDREIGYAINRRGRELSGEQCVLWQKGGHADYRSCLAYAGSTIADWTCQYGLNLWRPIKIGFAAWLVFSFIFFIFMHHPGPSGLYLAVANGLILEPDAIKEAPQVRSSPLGPALKDRQLLRWLTEELRLVKIAAFFGLVNGFNIGFKDADIGRWLRLLPAREFEFRAVGWSRTLAGIQALLTLYLLTIWVLCFFGHPFG